MRYTKAQRKELAKLNLPAYEELSKSEDFEISESGKRLLKIAKKVLKED